MDAATSLLDFLLHVDRHLGAFVHDHGAWVHALLFAFVFVETEMVVMPFLPGDSLLFVSGALLWVLGLTAAGFEFVQHPFVQQHLDPYIWALILVRGLIEVVDGLRARRVARDVDAASTAAR